ncbi:MAG: rod shape-determining protein MreC [Chloroflexota bacterium]
MRIPPRILQNITLAFIVIGILLLALGGYFSSLTGIALSPMIAAQTWFSGRYQAINLFLNAPRDTAKLQQRNTELESEVARLRSQIVDLQQQMEDVTVLKSLLKFASANPENDYLAASVIGRDPSPFMHYVIINRGSNDGLRRGMPVVTEQGLVGRVISVTAGAARVRLITDPAVSVNVNLKESPSGTDDLAGISVRLQTAKVEEVELIGSITGDIYLDRIPLDANIKPGDLVLTSGLGGNYVPNIFIGQITGVRKREFDLFQTASVQPAVDFKNLTIVMIITNFKPIDIGPLVPTPTPATP